MEPKLLDRVRQTIRVRHYSQRTEEAYVPWIRRYIVFHGMNVAECVTMSPGCSATLVTGPHQGPPNISIWTPPSSRKKRRDKTSSRKDDVGRFERASVRWEPD